MEAARFWVVARLYWCCPTPNVGRRILALTSVLLLALMLGNVGISFLSRWCFNAVEQKQPAVLTRNLILLALVVV